MTTGCLELRTYRRTPVLRRDRAAGASLSVAGKGKKMACPLIASVSRHEGLTDHAQTKRSYYAE